MPGLGGDDRVLGRRARNGAEHRRRGLFQLARVPFASSGDGVIRKLLGRSIERWHARSRLLAGGRSSFLRLRRCAASVATVTIEAQASKPVNLLGRGRSARSAGWIHTGQVSELAATAMIGSFVWHPPVTFAPLSVQIRKDTRTATAGPTLAPNRAKHPAPVVTNPESRQFTSDDDNDRG